ncbi:Fibrinogen- domains (FReDs) [Branchiostoma belcheri]|nr:Fibrinogen- domains (FReDs) [Branchiostoma belcheri]
MSSKKLVPNGEAAPEGSVGRHGNRWTNGIVVAMSGLAAVVAFIALLFMGDTGFVRDQQEAFMKQQTDLRGELQGLKDQVLQMQLKQQENEAKDTGPAGSTDDWRRVDSATFWKSAEVHRRSKRNSEAKTVVILGKRSDLGCLSGPPATDGPPQVTTPAAPTAPPQVTTPAATTAPPQVTTPAATTAPPADTDCAAYKAAGHTTSGVYTLGSPLSGVTVYCDMDTAGGGWTVIQRRQDNSVPFDRTWEEYKQGFGNKNGEYWLGNENINRLTAQKDYRLRIDMMDINGQERYAEYNTFRVAGESDGYRLTISGYSGTAGDSMTHIYSNNGQRFSTVDRDNDDDRERHCSQRHAQGGWWYKRCGTSFLNGNLLRNCGLHYCSYSQVIGLEESRDAFASGNVSVAVQRFSDID